MARKLAIEIIGDAASLKAALGSAAAATEKFATGFAASFDGMSTATLRQTYAMDKLAIATAKYGIGTTGAAGATIAYTKEMDALAAASTRAAAAQTRAAGSVGRAITTGITVPTLLVGYAAVKMGIEFSRNMLMIQTQAGASAHEVKQLSGEVLQLAKVSPEGPVELAKGLYHLESLGLRGSQAMKSLRISAIAAGMGIADIEDVTTAFGGAVVSGIKGTENFQKAMGTLNATIGAGNMRMADLAAGLGTGLLPAAENAGLTLDQVGAAMAVMTDRGVSAENAGTRLRMTFALMQAPSTKAAKALADMGISAEDMAIKLHSPNGLLKVLEMLHAGIERTGKVRGSADILHAFGGGRSGAAILTLIQSLDSGISSYQGKLQQIRTGQKKFGEDMKVYMESPSYKLSVALNTIKSDLTQLGGSLAPTVVGMGKAISVIADGFSALPGPIKQDMGLVIGVLAVGGPLLLAVSGVKRMVASIAVMFRTIPPAAAIASTAVEGDMVGVQTAVATTSAEVVTLRSRLLGLKKIGPIAIAIALSFVPPNKKGQKILDDAGIGGIGKIPILGNLFQQEVKGEDWLLKKAGIKGLTPDLPKSVSILDETYAQAKKKQPGLTRRDYDNIRRDARRRQAAAAGATPGSSVKKVVRAAGPAAPRTTLPKRFIEEEQWAVIHGSLEESLKVAKEEEAFFKKQLSMSKKGTDTYDVILKQLAAAHQQVESFASQISGGATKKAKFSLPAGLATSLSAAMASGDDNKELAALQKVVRYLDRLISGEKNVARKAKEEAKLASVLSTIATVRKAIGKKIIEALQAKVDLAGTTPGMSDDITALNNLRSELNKQLSLQKGNVEIQKQLDAVNKQFAQMHQQLVDELRTVMGTLGSGPVIDPANDPMRAWMLGVRRSAKDYLADIKKQISEFKMLQSDLNKLSKAGAPKALIDELRGQGMAAFPELFALAHADKGTLRKFFQTYKEREKLLMQTADVEMKANTVNITVGKFDLRPPSGIVSSTSSNAFDSTLSGRPSKPDLSGVGTGGNGTGSKGGRTSSMAPQHVHVSVDGHEIAHILLPYQQRTERSNAAQVRGRHGGRSVGR